MAVRAQEKHEKNVAHQLTLSCDNNLFTFNGQDGYYTNGIFLKYDRANKKHQSDSLRLISSYEIGQMIYNAHSRKILDKSNSSFSGGIEQIDRPITGYLFGKASYSYFYRHNRLLTFGISIGNVGKNSLGKTVQESWHKVIGIKKYWNWVWDYELKSETGININGIYAFSLIKHTRPSRFQITPVTQATLGTIFTHVSQAAVIQFGKIRHMASSSYWNSRLQPSTTKDDRSAEFFLFYRPEIRYQVYNATVQGGMLRHDKGPITSEINPIFLSHDIGIRYSTSTYCFGYHVTFQSREAKSQFHRHVFANIVFSVRL